MPITRKTILNPQGKLIGELYRSKKNHKWNWRTRSAFNGKKTGSGHEHFERKSGAEKGLLLHYGELRAIRTVSK